MQRRRDWGPRCSTLRMLGETALIFYHFLDKLLGRCFRLAVAQLRRQVGWSVVFDLACPHGGMP